MKPIVTKEVMVKHKVLFMSSHIVNSIILFIKDVGEKSFLQMTRYTEQDLSDMVNYSYEFTLDDIAHLSTFLNLGITVITNYESQPVSNEQKEE